VQEKEGENLFRGLTPSESLKKNQARGVAEEPVEVLSESRVKDYKTCRLKWEKHQHPAAGSVTKKKTTIREGGRTAVRS